MTSSTVSGEGEGARPGARTLALLADPIHVAVLRSLSAQPRRQADLRRESGSPAQSTLRAHLRSLEGIGAIAKHRRNAFPGTLEYELEAPGEELLSIAAGLERWLATAPGEALALGDGAAGPAIDALVEGWSTTMIDSLAAEALSLTQLDRAIGSLSYPSLERRLAALRLAGLVEPRPALDRGKPYAVSGWGRAAIAPLAAAARWERRHLEAAPPIERRDVEAAFLLIAPALRPPAGVAGVCRLTAEVRERGARRPAGVTVAVEDGAISACTTSLRGVADSWAHGSPAAWLDAVLARDADRLQLGGSRGLALGLLESMRRAPAGGERLPAP